MRALICVAALCVAQSSALLPPAHHRRPAPAAASRTRQPRLALAVPASPVPASARPARTGPARVPFWEGSAPPPSSDEASPMLSGLQGQALRVEAADVPSRNQVRLALLSQPEPEHPSTATAVARLTPTLTLTLT